MTYSAVYEPVYIVTRKFVDGMLEGLTVTQLSTVKQSVGRMYRGCLGTSSYIVTRCEPAPASGKVEQVRA